MIRVFSHMSLIALLLLLSTSNVPGNLPTPASVKDEQTRPVESSSGWIPGRTQCSPGKKGIIAPVPLHPVVEVLVAAGDRVKKDQVLVRLDDDEPKADAENKKALMDSCRVAKEEADRYLARAEELYKSGAYPEAKYYGARTTAQKAAHDEQAAKCAWESAKAELEHYALVAFTDGVVAWLDVYPGTVSRPGTTVWGEILDLSEIDVRCAVTLDQVDRLAVGQTAEVRSKRKPGETVFAKVVVVGITVDNTTGLVPVVVRVPNRLGVLRCGEAVEVRLSAAAK